MWFPVLFAAQHRLHEDDDLPTDGADGSIIGGTLAPRKMIGAAGGSGTKRYQCRPMIALLMKLATRVKDFDLSI